LKNYQQPIDNIYEEIYIKLMDKTMFKSRYYIIILAILIVFIGGFIIKNKIESKNSINVNQIMNLGSVINSSGDDFSPSLTADGKTMVFSSKTEKEDSHNIYISYFRNGKWTDPEFMNEINSKDNDETPFITPEGDLLLFSSDRKESLRPQVSDDGTSRVTYDIYISNLVDGRWSKPLPLKGEVNTTLNERSPALSPDRKTLYFSRWPYRNIKRAKIMQATFSKGEYSEVDAMPAPVNTGNYDLGLVPSNNKAGFYFSSMRKGGYGGWDLYFVSYIDGKFGEAVNLGSKINSDENDMFLSEVGDMIYFCSSRTGGYGGYDIYFAEVPDEVKKLKKREEVVESEKKQTETTPASNSSIIIELIDSETGKSLTGTTRIGFVNSKNPDADPDDTVSKKTDQSGKIRISAGPKTSWIYTEVFKTGYETYRKNHAIDNGQTNTVTIKLVPEFSNIEKKKEPEKTVEPEEKEIIIKKEKIKKTDDDYDVIKAPKENKNGNGYKPVYFSFNSSKIRLNEIPKLQKLVESIRDDENIRISITGHSDKWGTPESNFKISYYRALSVQRYLVKMGIDPCRIKVRGAGSKYSVYKSYSRYASNMNRRAEIKITKR
jgi:outer membrane protein OmpA-like peptidoglycan-associated protein